MKSKFPHPKATENEKREILFVIGRILRMYQHFLLPCLITTFLYAFFIPPLFHRHRLSSQHHPPCTPSPAGIPFPSSSSFPIPFTFFSSHFPSTHSPSPSLSLFYLIFLLINPFLSHSIPIICLSHPHWFSRHSTGFHESSAVPCFRFDIFKSKGSSAKGVITQDKQKG